LPQGRAGPGSFLNVIYRVGTTFHDTADTPDAGALLKMGQNQGFLFGRDSAHDRVGRERLVAGFTFQALAARRRDAVFGLVRSAGNKDRL
jgi:hypothetical protein